MSTGPAPEMTPAERRRAILGDEVIAQIHARVAEAPEPSDELVEELRRIITRPGGARRSRPADAA